jgi:hypothetical protein
MSTFSKKYYSPKNPDMFLSVSWETGYRNIQVFHEGRLVHAINQPTVLVKGVKIQDEKLGTLKFFFSESRPRKLEIKVNRRKFKTINKLNLGYDYTGLITIFTTLSVLAVCESFVLGGLYEFNFSYPLFSFAFTSGFVIAALYGVTSYLLSKRKSWSFFMGTSMFVVNDIDFNNKYRDDPQFGCKFHSIDCSLLNAHLYAISSKAHFKRSEAGTNFSTRRWFD